MKSGKHVHTDSSPCGWHCELGPHGFGLHGVEGNTGTCAKRAMFDVKKRTRIFLKLFWDLDHEHGCNTYVVLNNIWQKDRLFERVDKRKSDYDSLLDRMRLIRNFQDKDLYISDCYKPHSGDNPCWLYTRVCRLEDYQDILLYRSKPPGYL